MIVFPNVKINLGLNIVEKRPDGYHNLETVFYPVPLCEALEIVPAKGDSDVLNVFGAQVSGDPNANLVMRALSALRKDFPQIPALEVSLLKKLPMGAGLGGGSSDGAFMLKMLNECYGLGLSQQQLIEYAAKLGADCPFFLVNKPVYATGIGEIMQPVGMSLEGYSIVLVKPDVFVSTKEAFAGIKPKPTSLSARDIVSMPVEQWKDLLVNDFENTIFPLHPEIAEVKDKLYSAGAVYSAMSGSGASVLALFAPGKDVPSPALFPGCFFFQTVLPPI
ncbi:MAG: 4-(cytidine 5'-diphospho)-2-C-methyl-D-erythritol kinase [Bacteroidales bacterium]|nr:4-(cytidine 5'-diphospho)-2-C-methyl-D-erythritol kinase [Candidatus Physcocola equi]